MAARKLEAGRTGVRGETYAYWYLRRKGYVFVARNYMSRGAKGEIDLIGYDGKTLAFVEVRTRTVSDAMTALPESASRQIGSELSFARRGGFLGSGTGRLSLPVRCAGD